LMVSTETFFKSPTAVTVLAPQQHEQPSCQFGSQPFYNPAQSSKQL
jgi:hypothetical protein